MSSGLSDTAICNMALDLLEEAPIADIDDDLSVPRWFKRNFWPTAGALLRSYPWKFALARVSLPADATAPSFGWSFAYNIPGDSLRILPLTYQGLKDGHPITHEVEGSQILTNLPGPLLVRYIRRISNTGLFDNLFCEALAALLAQKAAHFITGKQSYAQLMQQAYSLAVTQAQNVNALEGTPDRPIDDDWLLARGSGTFPYAEFPR